MTITEVRIKLVEENNERLLAFCSVTLDHSFVIRDLKIIEGTRGMFVAMPSRKLTDRCGRCGSKNHLRSRFCNACGSRTDENRALKDMDGRAKLHADIAHPIHSSARELMSGSVLRAYVEEREKAKLPGYVCRYDEVDAGDFDEVPLSYGSMVAQDGRQPAKVHGPHTTGSKGTHFNTREVEAGMRASREDSFGVGVG